MRPLAEPAGREQRHKPSPLLAQSKPLNRKRGCRGFSKVTRLSTSNRAQRLPPASPYELTLLLSLPSGFPRTYFSPSIV